MTQVLPITSSTRKREAPKVSDSTYGVESMETSISSEIGDFGEAPEGARNTRSPDIQLAIPKYSGETFDSAESPSIGPSNHASRATSPSYQRSSSHATISRPFTPLSFGSPAPESLLGSFYSRRNSDAGSLPDESASQAILSSEDGDREARSDMMESGSAPQLIMPSIRMPSRRPFTERGKRMGRFKMLIAGDSGM